MDSKLEKADSKINLLVYFIIGGIVVKEGLTSIR